MLQRRSEHPSLTFTFALSVLPVSMYLCLSVLAETFQSKLQAWCPFTPKSVCIS